MQTTVRITKLERHEAGFFTAHVTAAGLDTVTVDNSIGAWSLPRDPSMPLGARCARRMILGWCVVLLNKRVRAFERGEANDESDEHAPARETPVRAQRQTDRGAKPKVTPADAIAARMASAAADAVKTHKEAA